MTVHSSPGLQFSCMVRELDLGRGRVGFWSWLWSRGMGKIRACGLFCESSPRVIDHCSRGRHDRPSNSVLRVLGVVDVRIRGRLVRGRLAERREGLHRSNYR